MGSSNIGRGRLGREGRGGGYPAFQFGQVEPKGNGNLTIRGLLIRGKVADNSGHPRRGRPRGCRPQLSGARGDGTRQTPSTRMPVEQVPRGWFALSIAPNLASPPSLRPRPTSNFQQLNSIPPQFRGQPAQRARQGPVPRSTRASSSHSRSSPVSSACASPIPTQRVLLSEGSRPPHVVEGHGTEPRSIDNL